MDNYQRIAGNFHTTIETIMSSVDRVAAPLERANQVITHALLADNKVLACGNGADAALAQLFVCNMMSRFEHERPALPALSLATDGSCITGIAGSSGFDDVFSRQVRSLGQQGDILLCFSSSEAQRNLLRAVQAANERNMTVVALSNADCGELDALVRAQDVHLPIIAPRRALVIELQTMLLNCLCELVDFSLFGNHHRE